MDHLDDESLLARLPRRSDEEPPTLRQDLLDEVRDYLQSAWEEEQRQTPDPHEAWQLVLQRFGDPAKLVRKLWFDALKEQIMSRRMILAAFGLAAVMFAVFSGLVWQTSAALQASAKSAREANLLLAEKLQMLGDELKALKSAPDLTWRRFRLQLKGVDGAAVRGQVRMYGMPFGTSGAERSGKLDSLVLPIGTDGLVDSGLIHVGTYDVEVQLENGYRLVLSHVAIQPGSDTELALVCPSPRNAQDARARLTFELPDAAKSEAERVWLLVRLEEVGREIDGTLWQFNGSERWGRTLMVAPTGEIWNAEPYTQSDGEGDSTNWRMIRNAIGSPVVLRDLDQHVWDEIVPAGVACRVISTELLVLKSHEAGSPTWEFSLCDPGVRTVFEQSHCDSARKSVELPLSTSAGKPFQWNIPLNGESVDGYLQSLQSLTEDEIEEMLQSGPMKQHGGGGGFF